MKLTEAIRALRSKVHEIAEDRGRDAALRDAADLLGVLAHIVDGKEVMKAFGAPGDWGYGTAIGKGVLDALERTHAQR